MASTQPHFRVALGTSGGRPSLLLQSRRGIYRSGIPDVLERLLDTLDPSDVLDFALGPQDQFWISCKSPRGRTYLTSEDLIDDLGLESSGKLRRLSLGGDYNFWAVTEDGSGHSSASWDVGSSELEDAISSLSESSALDDLKFLTLGNRDAYVYGTKSSLSWSGLHPSLTALLRGAKRDDIEVSNVVLSPSHADRWFVEFENASVSYSLPGFDSAVISSHTSPDASLRNTGVMVGPSMVVAKTSPAGATTLGVLKPNDHMYRTVSKLFYDGWKHASKRMAVIRDIYSITMPPSTTKAYGLYKASLQSRKGARPVSYTPAMEKRVFHGTRRACLLGNNPLKPVLCFSGDCALCVILRESLKAERAGSAPERNWLRFGAGIYTTSVSSKADDYCKNPDGSGSSLRAIVVCNVVLGNSFYITQTNEKLKGPPTGYDSVFGEVGDDLNYDEQVVYRNDAILPAFLIVYQP